MNNIKSARERAGISQKELAISMGVAQPTVSNWENGGRAPMGKNLSKLAELLGCSTDFLLGKTDSPTNPVAIKQAKSINLDDYPDLRCVLFFRKHGINDERNLNFLMYMMNILKQQEAMQVMEHVYCKQVN